MSQAADTRRWWFSWARRCVLACPEHLAYEETSQEQGERPNCINYYDSVQYRDIYRLRVTVILLPILAVLLVIFIVFCLWRRNNIKRHQRQMVFEAFSNIRGTVNRFFALRI